MKVESLALIMITGTAKGKGSGHWDEVCSVKNRSLLLVIGTIVSSKFVMRYKIPLMVPFFLDDSCLDDVLCVQYSVTLGWAWTVGLLSPNSK